MTETTGISVKEQHTAVFCPFLPKSFTGESESGTETDLDKISSIVMRETQIDIYRQVQLRLSSL